MDLSLVFSQGDGILIAVFLSLLLMSISSWWLILTRSIHLFQTKRQNRQFSEAFWQATDLHSATQLIHGQEAPLARVAQSGLDSLNRHQAQATRTLGQHCSLDEFLVRNIRMSLARETGRLEHGMTWLATVGATAPFVGLFGTVWGIYHALVGIAGAGQLSIAAVAGPIGEALVATAAGLAAAIPAVVAYNAFLRANRVIAQALDGFAHDLHAQLLSAEKA